MSFPRVLAGLVVALMFAVVPSEGRSQPGVPNPNTPPAPGLPGNPPAPGGPAPQPPPGAPGTPPPGTPSTPPNVPGTPTPNPPGPGTTPPGTVAPNPPGPGVTPAVPPGYRDAPNRYYYGRWAFSEASKYYYLKLHYHENPGDRAYKYHYVLAFPSQPRYAYYYDPGKKAFWGRYEYGSKPETCFCKLDPKLVGGNVTAAPPEAVSPPQPFGKVPGAVAATANIIAPPPHPGDLPSS